MASLAVGIQSNLCCQDQNLCSSSFDSSRRSSSMAVVPNRSRGKIVMSSSMAVDRRTRQRERKGNETAGAAAYEKVDEWMRDSVTEIVKNLREAPLLVHVYGGDEGEERRRMETEKKVEEESWDALKGKWEAGDAPLPEGVIFVEELMDDGEIDGGEDSGMTKAWGLVVQGKGEEYGPACYLLKTSRVNVRSGYGLGVGMGCTHFCLVRVSSFRETAQSQLKNSWLLQAQMQGLGR